VIGPGEQLTDQAGALAEHFSTALNFTSASSASICASNFGSYTVSWLARIDVAIEALTVEICRPPKPSWISTNAQHISRRR
jgi:hypothetical protein